MKRPVLFLIILFSIIAAGCSSGPGELDSFAQCLTEKGVVMYGTEWCPHCQNQKKMFGGSFKFIDYVDCDRNKEECVRAGVRGYPTWSIESENYPGEQSLSRLARLSGCNI